MKKQFLECGTSCRRLYWLMEVCEDWVASKGSFNSKLESNCLKLGVMVVVMCVCACVHNCRALYISPKDDSIIFIFPHWLIDWQWHICIECIVIIFTSHHSLSPLPLSMTLFPVSPISFPFLCRPHSGSHICCVLKVAEALPYPEDNVSISSPSSTSTLVFLLFRNGLQAWGWVTEMRCLGQSTQSHWFSTHWQLSISVLTLQKETSLT